MFFESRPAFCPPIGHGLDELTVNRRVLTSLSAVMVLFRRGPEAEKAALRITRVADPVRAFVYMIESPGPRDLFDGRTEGRVLREALRIADVRTEYRAGAILT